MRRSVVAVWASVTMALIAAGTRENPPFIWNASRSVPIGLYRVLEHPPVQGELAAIRLPHSIATLANERGYLPGRALLLKPIIAVGGGRICRWRNQVFVNGVLRAQSVDFDSRGRRLPAWTGCVTLAADQALVLGRPHDSFDSRYFGPISVGAIVGRAIPIWTLQD